MSVKLYVWEGVLTDWTSGMVCILANSEEEAWDLLFKKDKIAWSALQDENDRYGWNFFEAIKKDRNLDLSELRKEYLNKNKMVCFDTAKRPRVVEEPEAFAVWGGG